MWSDSPDFLLINYLFSFYGTFSGILFKKLQHPAKLMTFIKSMEPVVILFILIILYFTILTGTVGYSRFRVPFMPFINILCSVGLTKFYTNIVHRFKFEKI